MLSLFIYIVTTCNIERMSEVSATLINSLSIETPLIKVRATCTPPYPVYIYA